MQINSSMQKSSKVAIVTGGAVGIGASIVTLLCQRGHSVVIADIDERNGLGLAQALDPDGECVDFVRTDVSSSAEVEHLVLHTLQKFGRLDWLVNNAGIVRAKSTVECTEEEWDQVLAVNLKGAWLCSKASIPHLARQPGAAIVNVASNAGLVGFTNLVSYCASKGGMIQLTKACALDCASLGIRVNAVAPGHTRTPMGMSFINAQPDPVAFEVEHINRSHPIGRMAEPEEVAEAVYFLLSGASSNITGAILSVDGGYVAR